MCLTTEQWKFTIFVIVAVTALIMAILSCLMRTKKGTKEHAWWVFLMCFCWISFGVGCALSGYQGYLTFTMKGKAQTLKNTASDAVSNFTASLSNSNGNNAAANEAAANAISNGLTSVMGMFM